MQAFHNKQEVKDKYTARMKQHIESDELIRGIGFDYGKGCAVGCTLNNYNHAQYPIELGIPEWLARVEDRIFEGMSSEKSKTFPLEFLETINVGADLEKIKTPFLIFILESTLDKFNHKEYPKVLESINEVINLYKNGETDLNKVNVARRNAAYAADVAAAYAADVAAADAAAAYAADVAAADAADVAAAYAADVAAAAVAAADVAYAAVAAAYAAAAAVAAAYAAVAAADAAYAAAAAAAAADVADVADVAYAAREKTYNKFADKLIELIKECK